MGEYRRSDAAESKIIYKVYNRQTFVAVRIKNTFKVKENPLPWLEWVLNGADHTNFFENRVTEYEVAGLTGDWDSAYKQ